MPPRVLIREFFLPSVHHFPTPHVRRLRWHTPHQTVTVCALCHRPSQPAELSGRPRCALPGARLTLNRISEHQLFRFPAAPALNQTSFLFNCCHISNHIPSKSQSNNVQMEAPPNTRALVCQDGAACSLQGAAGFAQRFLATSPHPLRSSRNPGLGRVLPCPAPQAAQTHGGLSAGTRPGQNPEPQGLSGRRWCCRLTAA